MFTIPTRLHTIFVSIGPTNCGKTTFCNKLVKSLSSKVIDEKKNLNVQYISSDDIRRDMLGTNVVTGVNVTETCINKYDQQMMEISSNAFELLHTKVTLLTKFPVNAEFVVIDSTGLSEIFRKRLENIAYENHYNLEYIVFDYKDRTDYYKLPNGNKTVISLQIDKLRTNVLGSLGHTKRHNIRNYINDVECTIENLSEYQQTFLDPERNYFIFGDVHTCVDELKSLLMKAQFDSKST